MFPLCRLRRTLTPPPPSFSLSASKFSASHTPSTWLRMAAVSLDSSPPNLSRHPSSADRWVPHNRRRRRFRGLWLLCPSMGRPGCVGPVLWLPPLLLLSATWRNSFAKWRTETTPETTPETWEGMTDMPCHKGGEGESRSSMLVQEGCVAASEERRSANRRHLLLHDAWRCLLFLQSHLLQTCQHCW